MNYLSIKSEQDYKQALARLENIFDAKQGSPEGNELEVLSILVEHHENKKFPIEAPDPIAAIEFRMDQMGMKKKDLAQILGFSSRVSEILSRKRKLNLNMIRKLSKA